MAAPLPAEAMARRPSAARAAPRLAPARACRQPKRRRSASSLQRLPPEPFEIIVCSSLGLLLSMTAFSVGRDLRFELHVDYDASTVPTEQDRKKADEAVF